MQTTSGGGHELSIATRCRTVKEFVAAFHHHVRDDAIFISQVEPRPPGTSVAVALLLADGTPVLRGSCMVRESWTTNDNPFGSPGMLLAIEELTPRSKLAFQQLLSARDDESCFEQPTRLASIPPPIEAHRSAPVTAIAPPQKRLWRFARLIPVAASAAGAIVVVASLWPQSGGEAATAAGPAPLVASPAPPVARPERAAIPSAGAGPCRLEVTTMPAGASVAIDGKLSGTTPVAIATACGQHRVDLSHPQYQPITAWAPLIAGQPEAIDLVLARPIHALAVTSRPPGARILIDNQLAGTTPAVLSVLGYVPLTLQVEKPGYRPAVEHVYSTAPRDTLAVQLVKP